MFDNARRIKALENRIKALELALEKKQDIEVCMGVKEVYRGFVPSYCVPMSGYSYTTVMELINLLMAHLKLKFVETPGTPAKRELVKK